MKSSVGNWLLRPFSILYGLLLDIRNWLFDHHVLKSTKPAVYSISVGNLTVGGTGKTPMIEFLIKRYLATESTQVGETATLSRGYGRQTKGFRIVTTTDSAETVGDEPLQIYRKFGAWVRVCVGERRVEAIQKLLMHHPETKQILLDDAFQHRAVQPHLSILLTDYNRPFYNDHPFPAGLLRERRKGARRADVIVVTKCPLNLWVAEQQRMVEKIRPYARLQVPIFFAGLQYGDPVPFANERSVMNLRNVVLVSGLANANPLEQHVRQTFTLTKHHQFADHYAYSRSDLDTIIGNLPAGSAVLTTEKDWVKLDALLTPEERNSLPLYYLPITTQFLADQKTSFDAFLNDFASS